jgi:hypothetical protein
MAGDLEHVCAGDVSVQITGELLLDVTAGAHFASLSPAKGARNVAVAELSEEEEDDVAEE